MEVSWSPVMFLLHIKYSYCSNPASSEILSAVDLYRIFCTNHFFLFLLLLSISVMNGKLNFYLWFSQMRDSPGKWHRSLNTWRKSRKFNNGPDILVLRAFKCRETVLHIGGCVFNILVALCRRLKESGRSIYFRAWRRVHSPTLQTRPLSTSARTLQTHNPASTTSSLTKNRRPLCHQGQRSSPCQPFSPLRSRYRPSR